MMLCWAVLISLLGTAAANIVVLTVNNRTKKVFYTIEAAFGPPFDERSRVRGYMRLADPEDACTPIAPPLEKFKLPWFVLIARTPNINNCPFDKKVLNAQKAGYKGAVIHNVEGSGDDIFIMHGSAKYSRNITIPSQLIGYEDSLELRQFILGWTYKFELNGQQPELPDPYFYIIPFFVVICIIVVILVIALIVKLCREYFHSRRSRLSKRNLKKLPTKKFVKNTDPYETCAVCLDDFEDGDKIRILPCNHAYHCLCIDPWLLKRKRSCPVCKRKIHFGKKRRDVPTADPDSSDSGDERTPLLGATAGAGPSTQTSAVAVGAINSGSASEDDYSSDETDAPGSERERTEAPTGGFLAAICRRIRPRRVAYVAAEEPRPASYGSFNPVPQAASSPSMADHQVEVHAPPAAAAAVADPAAETEVKPDAEIV